MSALDVIRSFRIIKYHFKTICKDSTLEDIEHKLRFSFLFSKDEVINTQKEFEQRLDRFLLKLRTDILDYAFDGLSFEYDNKHFLITPFNLSLRHPLKKTHFGLDIFCYESQSRIEVVIKQKYIRLLQKDTDFQLIIKAIDQDNCSRDIRDKINQYISNKK